MNNVRVCITNLQSDAWVRHLRKVGQSTGKKEVSKQQSQARFESSVRYVEQSRQRNQVSRRVLVSLSDDRVDHA